MTIVGHCFLMLILGSILTGGDCRLLNWTGDDETQVRRAVCSLECSDELCITNCIRTKQIKELDEEAKADARLVCRDESWMVLAHNPGLFVIEIWHGGEPLRYQSKISNATQVEIPPPLWPYTYRFRLRRLSTSGISMPETTEEIETPPAYGYRPMDVTNITIRGFEVQILLRDPLYWKMEISFSPSEDRPCYYEVRCQQDDGEYNRVIYLKDVEDSSVSFRRLPFAANFTVTIKSLTDSLRWGDLTDFRGTIKTFSTPRCYHGPNECVPKAVRGLNATTIHKTGNIFDVNVTWVKPDEAVYVEYSIDIQPIGGKTEDRVSKVVDKYVSSRGTNVVVRNVTILDQYDVYISAKNWIGRGPKISRRFTTGLKRIVAVEGLNATATPNVNNAFDIRVTWDWPEVIPDFYIVNVILNGSETNHPVFHNISGSANETVFSDVEISEDLFVSRTLELTMNETRVDVPEDNRVPIYLGGTITIMVIGSIIAAYGYYRLRKRRLNKPVDKFEMSPDRLIITRVLGTGAFGVVKLGSLRDDEGNISNVAVKMLQDDSIENELRSFRNEIELMKSIGKHPNLVSILGCCTNSPYPFLVVEYCSRGDLQSYLRKSLRIESTVSVGGTKKCTVPRGRSPIRKEIPQENREDSSTSEISDDYIQVSGSPEDQDTNSDAEIVTMMDMLNFGRQIATGMEFLSSSRIVHRDLATRNVLVCRDRSVKISDFGLSRDVYQENFYIKWGNGRMPLKWMAIEALTHQVYTTYSDVWSFGILLWEIVTRGGSPYPGVPTIEILARLLSGYRMTRPANCSDPLYNVMLSCWQERPKDRPTFTFLRQELDKLICAIAEDEYFDLNEVPEETPL